jgi:hypothetical protein
LPYAQVPNLTPSRHRRQGDCRAAEAHQEASHDAAHHDDNRHDFDPGSTTPSGFVGPAEAYPNPQLTPGTMNPAVTQANITQNICKVGWSTSTVRDTQSTPAEKNTTYQTYGIPHPTNNSGANQTCELDHLISIENGGGDGLKNIWPECGPANVALAKRFQDERRRRKLRAQRHPF